MRPVAGYAEIVVCTLAWGMIGSIVRLIDLPASVIVFFRLSLGALVVLGYLTVRRRLGELVPRRRPGLLVAAGVTLGIHWLLLFVGYQRAGVVATILIVFIGPVLWAAAAPVVLRERLRAAAVCSLLVAFAGIALISIPEIGVLDPIGLLAAFGSAVLFAVLVLIGKLLTQEYEPAVIVVWQLGVASVLMAPALLGARWEQVARGAPGLLALGLVHTGLLGILFFRAVKALETQRLGVLFYLEPASAVVYAWWLVGERPSAVMLVGGGLIVLAGLAIIVTDRRAAAPGAIPEPVETR